MTRFTEAESQRAIFVNPALVRVVMQGVGKGTDIIFDNGHLTTVTETLEQVVRVLDEE
jgi:hypothetical protein